MTWNSSTYQKGVGCGKPGEKPALRPQVRHLTLLCLSVLPTKADVWLLPRGTERHWKSLNPRPDQCHHTQRLPRMGEKQSSGSLVACPAHGSSLLRLQNVCHTAAKMGTEINIFHAITFPGAPYF